MNQCCEKLGQPKERFVFTGWDTQTKEPVQIHLPKSIVLKIREAQLIKPTLIQNLLLWLAKILGQKPREKIFTITANGSRYEIRQQ